MTTKNFEAIAILLNNMYGVCGYLYTNNNGTYKYVDNTVARLTKTYVTDDVNFVGRCMREMRRQTSKVMPCDFEIVLRSDETERYFE